MRIFICLISFLFLNAALVETTLAEETPVEDRTAEITKDSAATPAIQPITQDMNARLEKVERIVNNSALLDMLELLESLKLEITTLRGEVEVQTHTIDQLKQKQRDLYTDVDNRIQRIESNSSANDTTTDSIADEEAMANVNVDEDADAEPVDPLKAEAVYQKAFKLLKEAQYDQALVAFKKFLKDYPDSPFSDNAQYWLGEANYVTQNYELAINEYQALLNTFPDSKKVSHALLKIGYSYAELGNAADATKTLNEVKLQYPGTTAARLADERLRKIGSEEETNT
ncbi:MAG TPA: tol-pal system protein YbgF [Thiotrichaceae bacterium]|jgi:tol-pal system protein YbgF|nr:tol-pal system protein YbgF [Thiotrichaceae bacterium]HIM07577.1 tol-pal system protein YbgF [Gammaproteobacteria bacterium]